MRTMIQWRLCYQSSLTWFTCGLLLGGMLAIGWHDVWMSHQVTEGTLRSFVASVQTSLTNVQAVTDQQRQLTERLLQHLPAERKQPERQKWTTPRWGAR